MTYDELVSRVQSYVDNDDPNFVAQMPYFVEQAENDIALTVQLPSSNTTATYALPTGTSSITVPADFRAALSLAVTRSTSIAWTFLREVQPDFLRQAYPTTALGFPTRYAIKNATTLIFAPALDSLCNFELEYSGTPPSLTQQTAGTWLSTIAGNVLLWGTVVQAYTWMKGDPNRLQGYQQLYVNALQQLKKLVDGDQKKDDFRDGDDRIPPQPQG